MRIKDPAFQDMDMHSCRSDPTESSFTTNNTINIVYGTQSGTAAHCAADIKKLLLAYFKKSKVSHVPKISVLAANSMPPEQLAHKISRCRLALFVTCTYGEGDFPDIMKKFWKHLDSYREEVFVAMRYGVFGLGSTMYAVIDEQFNRAARLLDKKLEELGGDRIAPVCLADDLDTTFDCGRGQWYEGKLNPWMKEILPGIMEDRTHGELSFDDELTEEDSY